MFLVMNKEKIYAYLVSIVMVVFLFFVATTFYTDKERWSFLKNFQRSAFLKKSVLSYKKSEGVVLTDGWKYIIVLDD